MGELLHLSSFAASPPGTLADDLLDKRLETARLSSIAHPAGFLAVLQWAMPEIGYQAFGVAALCVLGCVWDVVLGALLMLGVPAYACPALVALNWIS